MTKAAILTAPGQPLSIEEVVVELGEGILNL